MISDIEFSLLDSDNSSNDFVDLVKLTAFLGTGGLGPQGGLGALAVLELVEPVVGQLRMGAASEELKDGAGGPSPLLGVTDATGSPSLLLGVESLCLRGCLGGGGCSTAGGCSSDCTLFIGGGGSALFDCDGRSGEFLFPV